MSSISATGGGQGLYQFLQNLSASSQSLAASAATATDTTGTTTATSSTSSTGVTGARHHGRHGGGGGGEFKKIEAAVTSALQSAQSSGSTADPNQTIQDAIAKVFKDAGAPGSTPASGTPPTKSGTDPDGDGDKSGVAASGSGASATSAFFRSLKSFGVDPQQFHADLLAAFKSAQGGQVDPSAAFQSFPPGTTLNTVA